MAPPKEYDPEFWAWYEAYLKTPDWQIKRAQVLERCGGVCEGCGTGEAVEVHHTTYTHVGNEMLFELYGVCEFCHDRITDMDRKKTNAFKEWKRERAEQAMRR